MSKKLVYVEAEAFDEVVRQTLKDDYRGLCEEVRRLERKQNLQPHEKEDLQDSRKWRDALETMLSYYLMHNEAQEIIDEEYLKSEYSYGDAVEANFAEDIENDWQEPFDDEVEYHKDLKEKRIAMLEEQVEYLMKHANGWIEPGAKTFDGRRIHKDIWGKRYVMNENGIRTYIEPVED